jgi:hypothetical protein
MKAMESERQRFTRVEVSLFISRCHSNSEVLEQALGRSPHGPQLVGGPPDEGRQANSYNFKRYAMLTSARGEGSCEAEERQRGTAYLQHHHTYFPSIERALSSGALEIRIRPENG